MAVPPRRFARVPGTGRVRLTIDSDERGFIDACSSSLLRFGAPPCLADLLAQAYQRGRTRRPDEPGMNSGRDQGAACTLIYFHIVSRPQACGSTAGRRFVAAALFGLAGYS